MLFGIDLGLTSGLLILFVITIFVICAFEFVNGFHDTANAVATVIYTGTLKPVPAVIWSGIVNFLGVITSGYFFGMAVAVKIAALLPVEALIGQDMHHSIAMIMSVLIGAIIWNVGTWYFGIPCSSSHTMIGSLLGVGLVFSIMPENVEGVGVNWGEAAKIGKSLLFSPFFGFSMAIVLMFILRQLITKKEIFKEPEPGSRPPYWIRAILICTCTLVSFFHGSNDGQKGLGLMLIALMTFVPLKFALSPDFEPQKAAASLSIIQQNLPDLNLPEVLKAKESLAILITDVNGHNPADVKQRLNLRKRLSLLKKNMEVLLEEPYIITNQEGRKAIEAQIKDIGNYITFVPFWCLVLVSFSLGIGTMIGWKRIVVTIGEKIGKRHMTYAEGATAELIASSTIGLASGLGLPVSTTHVLSSGVAGAMVASKGVKNLQGDTVKNITLAWVLTLPATIILSGGLYYIFRNIF